jgi:hypothetical protein
MPFRPFGARKSADERLAEWRAKLPRNLIVIGVLFVLFSVLLPALTPFEMPSARSPLEARETEVPER